MNTETGAHSSALSSPTECLGSLGNECSGVTGSVDHSCCEVDSELMDSLVRDVRRLSETLTDLSVALDRPVSSTPATGKSQQDDADQDSEYGGWSVNVHQCLCNVLQVLKEAIIRYRFLQSNDIFEHIGFLVDVIKGLKFDEDAPENTAALRKAHATLENLQIAVAECVGEYLTWEMTQYENTAAKRSWSAEDLSAIAMPSGERPVAKKREKKHLRKQHSVGSEGVSKSQTAPELVLDHEDDLLDALDDGVEIALSRARAWSNYCKEVLNYVQRRINLESEHARAVQKLNVNTRLSISLEHFLPLRNIYLNSFHFENNFYDNCLDVMRNLYEYKFIKPLEARKAEIDAKRKDLKHSWEKCVKEVDNAVLEVRKARQNVVIRESNYKKARESMAKSESVKVDVQKIERRRKMQEEAFVRREQASKDYWSLQQRLDEKYREIARLKTKILQEVRELIYQCDQTTKACTVAYLQEIAKLWAVLPSQYQILAENARQYVPGTLYKEFIRKAVNASEHITEDSSAGKSKTLGENKLPVIQVNGDPVTTRNGAHRSSLPSSPDAAYYGKNDLESSMHVYQMLNFKMPRAKSRVVSRPSMLSDAALSHRLQKVRAPCKCCHCDTYTFFQTVGCTECGLNWHKTCLDNVNVHCQLAKQLKLDHRRMCIFGIPLARHLEETHLPVPLVLTSCIEELERKGLNTKGLYRVCGVKSSIEQICEKFERQQIELSSVLPTNIASIIKLYLRQLPEPLLTHALYHQFIEIAKKYPASKRMDSGSARNSIINELKHVCAQLPIGNYLTLKLLCLHLNRVSWFEVENQMSVANLGIVFGPSLLWTDEILAINSLKSLLDAPLQTRVVELLIKYAYEVFDENPTGDITRLRLLNRPSHGAEGDSNFRRQVRSMGPIMTSESGDKEEPNTVDRSPNSATPDLLRESKLVGRTTSLQDPVSTAMLIDELDPDFDCTLLSPDVDDTAKTFN